ncbi:putative voltage-gated potassium channel subunit beta [Chlorella sorokiniana]|uniref:Voltage-gated potassium channel subunit beta n=1 Tax=Chlorella sorokiniana TaxID=3076 RepID=A0A2P6TJZ7_CHLSO|nr:putative voltage-gated potassium channel subunit beta [Chlorella sorokiniana]|eukprot:PRW44395.1 putative voltage-gated potassium channel subunit beta [Chlorella sorokiniana]
MEYRRLGRTGLKVSTLSFGAWVSFGYQLGVPEAKKLIGAAYERGVNFFDNAETYAGGQAEEIMGQALRELGYKREEYVISTKVFFGTGSSAPNTTGLSRKHIIEGTRASLKRLGLEYVDLLFCHRPDPETPIEETVRAMNWCIDQGYAFYWGTSEWSAEQIEEAWRVAERLDLIGPAMEQPQYNIFHRKRVEEEYAPLYAKHGLGLTTWSPLASGVLTGKYSGGVIPEGARMTLERYKFLQEKKLVEKAHQLTIVDNLVPVAEELGCSMAQLSLAWCARNPNVSTVITGATKVSQIEDNMAALAVLPKLTDEVVAKIDNIVGGAWD